MLRSRRSCACAAVLAAVAACRPADQAERPAQDVVVLQPPAAAPTASASVTSSASSEKAVPSIATIERPKNPACVFKASSWMNVPPLRLHTTDPPFATASGPEMASVHVPTDVATQGLIVELDLGAVDIRAVAAPKDVSVYASVPIVLGGIFIPTGSASLTLVGSATGEVRVERTKVPQELTELQVPLDATAKCSDVSLKDSALDPEVGGKAIGQASFASASVPIAPTQGAKPIANLVAGKTSPNVDVLQRGKTETRIRWDLDSGFVVGWVANTSLGKPVNQPGVGYGSGTGRLGRRITSPQRIVRCTAPVRLGATVGDRSALIGTVQPGTRIYLYGNAGEGIEAILIDSSLKAEKGASLFVLPDEVRDCTTLPKP